MSEAVTWFFIASFFFMSHESPQHEQQQDSILLAAGVADCAKATLATAIVKPKTQMNFLNVFMMIAPIQK
ncbi:MAG TPA: hypothetical protein VE863_15800 [Pyrinomonadaceae bacterium]|nr:hypothetical protein [Pyrinomonadaceae bacterium]